MTVNVAQVDDVMLCVLNKDNNKLGSILKKTVSSVFDALLPRSSPIAKDNIAQEFVQTTPLFAAIKTGNVEAAKMLLDNGANIKRVISAPNGMLSSPYELCILSDNEDFNNMLKDYAITKGFVSATNVIRSGKSQALQYGSRLR